ncbi:MAG: universal stress protein [Bacteroidales bacterium]|nr:universal stress protein [Bacteroidales bacterium]
MNNLKKTILVPTDFTQVADYALQHAVRVSSVVHEPVTLLHIVDNPNKVAEAQAKMDQLAKETQTKYNILPATIIRLGDIFVDIAKVAVEINSGMVIMGSHRIKDESTLNDSIALKVIQSCKVPFITIQEPPINKRYDEIVFPIDDTAENIEKHSWISYFCDYYVSRFHLIKPNITDPKLLAKVDMNMASARRYLDEKGARYYVYTVTGKKPYAEEVLEMAANIRADLIVIMTTKVSNESTYTVEPHEQYIISNASYIPVMCINPQ